MSPLKFVVNMMNPPPPPPQSSSWFSFLHPLFTIILIIQAPLGSSNLEALYETCGKNFSCGGITGIRYPFRGFKDPAYCGHPGFVLTCDEHTNVTTLDIMNTQYRVLGIVQSHKIMTVAREDIMEDTCAKELVNTTLGHTIFEYDSSSRNFTFLYGCPEWFSAAFSSIPCGAYVVAGASGPGMCNTSVIIPGTGYEPLTTTSLNASQLDEALQKGFDIKWQMDSKNCSDCVASNGRCGIDLDNNQTVCYCPNQPFMSHTCNYLPASSPNDPGSSSRASIIAGAAAGIAGAIIFTIAIVFHIKRRRSLGGNKPPVKNRDIENVLQQYGALAPRRYKYSEIKKITKSFNDKLGQGGFGSVYKGALQDGSLVAVKVLTETDGNGEDFMNEVVSISRTSHVNIVTLLGFCNKGSKRALIYEYMPNKSLDMFLRNNVTAADTDCSLNFNTLYKIAVGIAKGLEYLHSGCNTRIVHFDIKPQNILLDEDLCPKISDFGLAKLCKKKQSVLSVIGARGTIGYIAPEMFSRNFGGVSHKSDVYSYGMMVLEMAGAKKIVEADAVGSSENYFPENIYKHVVIGGTHKVVDEFMSEEIGRKMFLVGFWCIQTSPSDRPSMSKVVEMLEGSVESIQIPPKPTLFSPALPAGHNISLPLSAYVESQTTNSDEES